MTIVVVTPPDSYPVSVDEAGQQVRAPSDGSDNDQVEIALRAATEYVEKETSRKLRTMTLEYRVNEWPCYLNGHDAAYYAIDLPVAPVRDVLAVRYLNDDAVEIELDEDDWSWERTAEGATVHFASSYSFPSVYGRPGSIRIEFLAGYDDVGSSGSGDDPNLILPFSAKSAVLLKTQLLYERDGLDEQQTKNLTFSLSALINALRIYR